MGTGINSRISADAATIDSGGQGRPKETTARMGDEQRIKLEAPHPPEAGWP